MSIDFRPLLSLNFWFDLAPTPPADAVSNVAFGALALFVVAAIVLRVLRRRTADKLTHALFAKIASLLAWMGCVGLAFFFFHYEQVSFFGARFWLILWLAGLVAWIVALVRFARRDMPRMRQQNAERSAKAKYL